MDFEDALWHARKRFSEHPLWWKLVSTPWENDAPVIAAELMCKTVPWDAQRLHRAYNDAEDAVARREQLAAVTAKVRAVVDEHERAERARCVAILRRVEEYVAEVDHQERREVMRSLEAAILEMEGRDG